MSVFITVKLRSGKEIEAPYYTGQGIGQFADEAELDAVAKQAGVRLLHEFYYFDRDLYEEMLDESEELGPDMVTGVEALEEAVEQIRKQPDWHDPEEGLRTVRALAEYYRRKLLERPGDDYLAEVVNDLSVYEIYLAAAAGNGDRFRLEVG
jgi:hypothetical protein